MTDFELSEKVKQAMIAHEYDKAIDYLSKMDRSDFAIKMQLLVIEHEQSFIRRNNLKVE